MERWWCIYFWLCFQVSLPLCIDEALHEEYPVENVFRWVYNCLKYLYFFTWNWTIKNIHCRQIKKKWCFKSNSYMIFTFESSVFVYGHVWNLCHDVSDRNIFIGRGTPLCFLRQHIRWIIVAMCLVIMRFVICIIMKMETFV